MVYSGSKTVTAAGTRERLATERTPAAWILFQPLDANQAAVFIGGSTVSATVGNILDTGGSITFPPIGDIMMYDLHEIWIDASTNGEGAQFNYGQR